MSGFTSDLRVVVRTLRRTPGFAVAAIGTLGLGMATTITAVLLVKAYLFTALPYPAADRLYDVRYAPPGQQSPAEMETLDWASLSDVAEQQIAWDLDAFYLIGGAQAEMRHACIADDGSLTHGAAAILMAAAERLPA